MTKPVLFVTHKLPQAVESRASRDYITRLTPDNTSWATNGAETARLASEIGAAGILCVPGDRLDSACINALPPSVKIIATFSVGFDHIDIVAAKARGIVVTNTPGVLSFAVAECALMLMLTAARRTGEADRSVRAGKWSTQIAGVTLENKKLGILGFGRIGQKLASIVRGFPMEIHYRNPERVPSELEQGAIYHDNDAAFLQTIDFLSMHLPDMEGTRKWLNAARLDMMKRGAIVVNTGRGSAVDDTALIAALKSGHIRAAGLDVFDGEPKVNPAYLTLENVTLLPHIGSATIETRDAIGYKALDNIDAVLLKRTAPPDRVV
ncbi:2-hydroxyacid dehydrogenase [Fimbriiglobus ruber]|uniref:D-3-phosphoglycerate dehydrogenase n=1 Tax=Fimbriiglobus ruber TaxID=1908690 RepID=A0A225D9D6_9BACT|nr:D-glycerate dehydrogenase [Fimbriiglobus ruber]OWK38220.1 D-3-phosphoglycerate dehydrogenase [Fimbriiglobus ruber]